MDDTEPDLEKAVTEGRIRWGDGGEASGTRRRPSLHRTQSASSLSIRAVRQVEPGILLPIQYRTVSFNIEETKGKEPSAVAARDHATKGLPYSPRPNPLPVVSH